MLIELPAPSVALAGTIPKSAVGGKQSITRVTSKAVTRIAGSKRAQIHGTEKALPHLGIAYKVRGRPPAFF